MTGMGTHNRDVPYPAERPAARRYPWPLLAIAAPAAVAIWTGWVGLGGKCGFGVVQPLPGIVSWHLNTAITLPVGIEAYAAYALSVWLVGNVSDRTRVFARKSAVGALTLGCLGQIAFHLLAAAGWVRAPWPVVMAVACLPVATLGFGATLFHLQWADRKAAREARDAEMGALEAERDAAVAAAAVARGEMAASAVAADAELRARLEAGRLAASEAERREAEAAARAEMLARKVAALEAKLARSVPAKKPPAGPRRTPADEVPHDVDAQAEALSILAAEPGISGAKLAERVGKSERWGQTFKKNLNGAKP